MFSPEAIAVAVVVLVAGLAFAWRPLVRWREQRETQQALSEFRLRREILEAKFFDVAAAQGKPRGLRWKSCDWQEAVTFGRDVHTHLLTAFVSVEIHFEAVEGGDMEGVEAVSTVREASAVFHYQKGRWGTGGKALFNMNPYDALTRLEGQYLAVGKNA